MPGKITNLVNIPTFYVYHPVHLIVTALSDEAK